MWNRNRAYLQPKNCFMNCLRTYIAQSCICPKKKKPMIYHVVRTIIQASKLQKEFIFSEIDFVGPIHFFRMISCTITVQKSSEGYFLNRIIHSISNCSSFNDGHIKMESEKQLFLLERIWVTDKGHRRDYGSTFCLAVSVEIYVDTVFIVSYN